MSATNNQKMKFLNLMSLNIKCQNSSLLPFTALSTLITPEVFLHLMQIFFIQSAQNTGRASPILSDCSLMNCSASHSPYSTLMILSVAELDPNHFSELSSEAYFLCLLLCLYSILSNLSLFFLSDTVYSLPSRIQSDFPVFHGSVLVFLCCIFIVGFLFHQSVFRGYDVNAYVQSIIMNQSNHLCLKWSLNF